MNISRITAEESDRAYEVWGANCGPGAIAAIMGMRLDDVRGHIPEFDKKRYTSPTMMYAALKSIGRPWRKAGKVWPNFGLVRIQWEGPWTEPGVPAKVAYWHTHWIASWFTVERGHGVFDINACANDTGWITRKQWETILAPYIISHVPRAYPSWHVTHGIEIDA